jgi:hypothetical protein
LVVLRSTEKQHLLRSISYIRWPGLVAPVLGDFHVAFALVGTVDLASVVDFPGLDADTGAIVSGRQKS